ncbi:MAG TPA: metallophosphoesterase [Vicinamibacterales bacterium]|jgi:hypothetical protein|nr:metallophosphoesterase [Vicinamibacterales bacterium]
MLELRAILFSVVALAALIVSVVFAQLPASSPAVPQVSAPVVPPALTFVPIRPIEPPAVPLPPESETANVTKFSFFAYGDTRGAGTPPGAAPVPSDGDILHPIHSKIVDAMLARVQALATTPFPVRFVVQSGDAVLRGATGAQWNVSFTPIIERLTRAGVSFFFSVGNHDVTGMPAGDPSRMLGLHNTLTAFSKLIPPEGSPRRLSAYPTYTVAFGNTFLIALDSNLAADTLQLTWVTDQLGHLDRTRYRHVIAVFHHPPFSSGPHGGDVVEPATLAIRNSYMPLFRKHHARMVITGHDHLYDHWVERYVDAGERHRLDSIVTGGGGAPVYIYDSEPDLQAYMAAGAAQSVRVEHLAAPGPTVADNPHHFVVVTIDGDRLSLEVVGIGPAPFAPFNGRSQIDLNDRVN